MKIDILLRILFVFLISCKSNGILRNVVDKPNSRVNRCTYGNNNDVVASMIRQNTLFVLLQDGKFVSFGMEKKELTVIDEGCVYAKILSNGTVVYAKIHKNGMKVFNASSRDEMGYLTIVVKF